MQLANSDTTILGIRYPSNGLYYVNLNPQYLSPASGPGPITHVANSAYSMTTKHDLVQYLHRAAFRPIFGIWTKVIDAVYFATWPILTYKLVRKHITLYLSIIKGHLWQDNQNIWSPQTDTTPNAPIFEVFKIMSNVMASATEAKISSTFINGQ